MKIQLEVDAENPECTDSPYWMIIDPRQMMSPDPYAVASMIEGPFFSRKEATDYLKSRRYAYSSRAIVFCHSGYRSLQYKEAIREAEKKVKEQS